MILAGPEGADPGPPDPAGVFTTATEALLTAWERLDPAVRATIPGELRQPLLDLLAGWLDGGSEPHREGTVHGGRT